MKRGLPGKAYHRKTIYSIICLRCNKSTEIGIIKLLFASLRRNMMLHYTDMNNKFLNSPIMSINKKQSPFFPY